MDYNIIKRFRTVAAVKPITVKGGALYYAIFVSFIIFAMCGFIITAAYLNRTILQRVEIRKQLENNAENMITAKVYGNIDLRSYPQCFESTYSVDHDTSSTLEIGYWGAFKIAKASLAFGTDTINKISLIGNVYKGDSLIALYLQDKNNYLTFTGTSKVFGNCYLPALGYKNSLSTINNQIIEPIENGDIEVSDDELPELAPNYYQQTYNYLLERNLGLPNCINYSDIEANDSLNQSFSQPTLNFINSNTDLRIINNIRGNIQIISAKPIILSKKSTLKSIIIYAPVITVENGFTGSVQLFATDSIHIESNCNLTYPSFVAIIPHPEKKYERSRYLILDSLSSVAGGLLALTPTEGKEIKETKMIIHKKTNITGLIYCTGEVQLQGKIMGSVYVSSVFIKSEWGNIGNTLENCKIDAVNLQPTFIFPDIIPSSHKRIITWLE